MRGTEDNRSSQHQRWRRTFLIFWLENVVCPSKQWRYKHHSWIFEHVQNLRPVLYSGFLVGSFLATNCLIIETLLSPSDFWLFPKMKESLMAVGFEIKQSVTRFLHFGCFPWGYKQWLKPYNKCLDVKKFHYEGDWWFEIFEINKCFTWRSLKTSKI